MYLWKLFLSEQFYGKPITTAHLLLHPILADIMTYFQYGAVYILCQPKMGGVQTPPPPLVSQKSEIGLPPLPPLSEKIKNWLTSPSPPLPPSSEIKL